MTKSNIDPTSVDWRPVWKGADLEEYNRLCANFRSQVASFRALRRALGLSQADAAKRLVTSQSNVSKIEAKSDLSLSSLRKLLGDDGELRIVAHLKNGSDIEFALGD